MLARRAALPGGARGRDDRRARPIRRTSPACSRPTFRRSRRKARSRSRSPGGRSASARNSSTISRSRSCTIALPTCARRCSCCIRRPTISSASTMRARSSLRRSIRRVSCRSSGADHLLGKRADAVYVADVIAAWSERYLDMVPEPDVMPLDGVLVGETGNGKFEQAVVIGSHRYLADEPTSVGGNGCGAEPLRIPAGGAWRLHVDDHPPLCRPEEAAAHRAWRYGSGTTRFTPPTARTARPRTARSTASSARSRSKAISIAGPARKTAGDRRQVSGTPHAAQRDRYQDQRSRMSVVIVGAGQAAAQLVQSLRQGGYKEPISMIGDEPYAPYQRPPLSKKFLTERPPAETLYFRPEKFWSDQGVTTRFDTPVLSIDRAAKRVELKDGRISITARCSLQPAPARATCHCRVRRSTACSRCARSTTCAVCAVRSTRRSASSSSAAATSGLRSRRSRAARGARSPCWRPRSA